MKRPISTVQGASGLGLTMNFYETVLYWISVNLNQRELTADFEDEVIRFVNRKWLRPQSVGFLTKILASPQ